MTKEEEIKLYKMGVEVRNALSNATPREFITIMCTTIDDYCEHHDKDTKEMAKLICITIQEKGEEECFALIVTGKCK